MVRRGPARAAASDRVYRRFRLDDVVGLMGLARRGQLRQGWILALTPVLGLFFDRGVARIVSTADRTVPVGEDRARPFPANPSKN